MARKFLNSGKGVEDKGIEPPNQLTARKEGDFMEWYDQVLSLAGIIDRSYAVKGMFVWLDYGLEIMQRIKSIWDELFRQNGIKEMYFPLIVPLEYATMNKEFYDAFRKQVFWVKGYHDSDTQYILRPTGEPAMYPLFATWVRTQSDLPIRIYQTVSSFRYETKETRALIRDREISYWYEIHTAHATKEEADEEIAMAISFNRKIWQRLAVMPLLVEKPFWECFPGAVGAYEFYTIMPTGRVLENGSCNHLGQAYSQRYGIKFKRPNGEESYVWQTCTGNGARYLAAVMAVHGDNRGLVLPPSIAPIQVAVIPILFKKGSEGVMEFAETIATTLNNFSIRSTVDKSDRTSGEKFYHWEMKGIPIRIEIGPAELREKLATLVRRDNGLKAIVKTQALSIEVAQLLDTIQQDMHKRTQKILEDRIRETDSLGDAINAVSGGLIAAVSWCGSKQCFDALNGLESGLEAIGSVPRENAICIVCKKPALRIMYLAKTY